MLLPHQLSYSWLKQPEENILKYAHLDFSMQDEYHRFSRSKTDYYTTGIDLDSSDVKILLITAISALRVL